VNSLLLEIERLRACLRGVASCCTCTVCREAAIRTLESSAKAAVEGVKFCDPLPAGTDCRGLPLEQR
jgi:hypothetical protein